MRRFATAIHAALEASPSAVARTARIQRAKRLLDETTLPISEIALASGFGSLCRFNAVFAEVFYHRAAKQDQNAQRANFVRFAAVSG
ncbi:MAG: helix-turn-helix domain-containing protein [Acetobacteraceae bacterium]